MTFAALALIASVRVGSSDVSEFFPLNPGDEWVYAEGGSAIGMSVTDTVGEAVEIEGKPAIPVFSKITGSTPDPVYYRIEDNTVFVVAFDPKKPLVLPYTILKYDPGKATSWSYTGETQFINEPADLWMKGSAKRMPAKDYKGTKRDMLEVTLEATVGAQQTGIKTKQVAIYAKGIGLIEMKETSQVGQKKSERTRKLVQYKPKAGG